MKIPTKFLLGTALIGAAAVWLVINSLQAQAPNSQVMQIAEHVLVAPPTTERFDTEHVVVEVSTAALPNGTELEFISDDGTLLGAVTFYGQTNPEPVQNHQILVLATLLPVGELTIKAFVINPEGRRPATKTEFLGVRLLRLE